MATKITRDVLEGYLHCKTKGHLKLAGQQGSRSDYEEMLASTRQEVRQTAIAKLLAQHSEGEIARDISITTAALRLGPLYVLSAILEDGLLSLEFDGLKRVAGPSKLGNFHYVPMVICQGRKIGKEQRLLLDLLGQLLSQVQGRQPAYGVVYHGRECKATKARLSPDLRRAERLLRELKEMVGLGSQPELILNDHCQVCEFRQRCQDRAVKEDNVSLLRGLSEKEVKGYARKGILTVTQLAHTFRPRRRGKRTSPKSNRRYHALHALAVRDKRVYVFGTPQLPDTPVRIYLDVEGDPEEGFDYLIGLIVIEGDKEQRFSFWADGRDQEDLIFEQFLATVNPHQDFAVFAYGSYERAFIKRMLKRTTQKSTADRVFKALVNPLSLIYRHIYFPTYSNGLKDVGACLGCVWSEPDASGAMSLVWRAHWETTHAEEWKQRLIAYNLEDCTALRKVTEFLYACCARCEPSTEPGPAPSEGPAVSRVEEIDRLGTVNRRGRIQFFHPDYDFINSRAHFDYQRQRVYVRKSKVRKSRRGGPRRWRNKKLRVSRRVQIISRKCPSCGSSGLRRLPKGKYFHGYSVKTKRAFDLVFTSGGIKRKVIECRTSIHQCAECGHEFIPVRYQRLAKHFHGLMSWAMHEHVAHRISCPVVAEMFKDFFGLTVYQQEITRFKAMMALYYRPCYKRLLDKILSGAVLQVDETEVSLRTGKGYVWVFATSEEVVYMYRPTREGDFLLKLLGDFRGVLVSDFFAAYDSIACPQQKCLIHLIRDMNQDLLDSPFDLNRSTQEGK
jgi:predicted RecB family nuclease